jgi:hypothetical protein
MKNIKALAQAVVLSALIMTPVGKAAFPESDFAVVVDKKTFQTHIANYNDGRLDVVKTFAPPWGKRRETKCSRGI